MRAIERASDEELEKLLAYLLEIEPDYSRSASAQQIVRLDETFHLQVAALSKNAELVRVLENINERVRYVRWISMRKKRDITHAAHQDILSAIVQRDSVTAIAKMRAHIEKSTDEANETVRAAFSQIYVPGEQTADNQLD